jgi:hypothetical protein
MCRDGHTTILLLKFGVCLAFLDIYGFVRAGPFLIRKRTVPGSCRSVQYSTRREIAWASSLKSKSPAAVGCGRVRRGRVRSGTVRRCGAVYAGSILYCMLIVL